MIDQVTLRYVCKKMNTYLSASPFQETSYQTQKWVMYKNMKRHLNMYYLRTHHEKKRCPNNLHCNSQRGGHKTYLNVYWLIKWHLDTYPRKWIHIWVHHHFMRHFFKHENGKPRRMKRHLNMYYLKNTGEEEMLK